MTAPRRPRTNTRATIDCEDHDIRRRFGAYVAGDLGDADRDAVDRHLDACGACRDKAAELVIGAVAAEGLDGEPTPPDLRNRVLAQIEHTPQEPERPGGADGSDVSAGDDGPDDEWS